MDEQGARDSMAAATAAIAEVVARLLEHDDRLVGGRDDALRAARAAALLTADLRLWSEHLVALHVERARLLGATWGDVGAALGPHRPHRAQTPDDPLTAGGQ